MTAWNFVSVASATAASPAALGACRDAAASASRRSRSSALLAWLSARTTLYVVTDAARRASRSASRCRSSINMPVQANRRGRRCARIADGTGDVAVASTRGQRIAYLDAVAAARGRSASPGRSRRCAASPTRARSARRWRAPWRRLPGRAARRAGASAGDRGRARPRRSSGSVRRAPMSRSSSKPARRRSPRRADRRRGAVGFAFGAVWLRARSPASAKFICRAQQAVSGAATCASCDRDDGGVSVVDASQRQGARHRRAGHQRLPARRAARLRAGAPARRRSAEAAVHADALERRHALACRTSDRPPHRPRRVRPDQRRGFRPTVRRQGATPNEPARRAWPPAVRSVPAPSKSSIRREACTPMSRSTATSWSSPATRCRCIDAPTDVRPSATASSCAARAVVTRAGAIERAWTRLLGNFELTELYDVSFTERRSL